MLLLLLFREWEPLPSFLQSGIAVVFRAPRWRSAKEI